MSCLDDFFSDTKINSFYKSLENSEDICAICNTKYDFANKVTLDCKHTYHEKCLNQLLENSHYLSCPYCNSYQPKYKLIKTCCYVTKNNKKCDKICFSDNKICIFHNRYIHKSKKCFAICKNGKKCSFNRQENSLFCKKHTS